MEQVWMKSLLACGLLRSFESGMVVHINVNIHIFVIWWSLQSTSDIALLGLRVSSWVRPTEGRGEPTRTMVPWRQGFRHPTRNERMGWFAQIPTEGVELKLASRMGQGKRLQPLHVPKMVKLCLKIGPHLYWIELVAMSSSMTPSSNSNSNLKSVQTKKKPSSTILGIHKSSCSFYVGPPNLQACSIKLYKTI